LVGKWLGGAAVLSVVACATLEGVMPTPGQLARAQARGITTDQLESGRTCFAERCTACHVAPKPSSRPAAEWPEEVDRMAKRSRLTPEQKQLILQYLQTVSEP
jgi:cytochrome c5